MEQPNIAERFQKAVTETTFSRKRSPWLYLLLLAVILVVGYDGYLRHNKLPGLGKENQQLKKTSSELQRKIVELQEIEGKNTVLLSNTIARLAPFEKEALRRYPNAEEEALSKLYEDLNNQDVKIIGLGEMTDQQEKKIRILEQTTRGQKKEVASLKGRVVQLEEENEKQRMEMEGLKEISAFYEVASWTLEGKLKLWNGQFVDSPVAGWTDNYYLKRNGEAHRWECGSVALFHYREIMEQYPKFPFPYYVVSQCLKMKGEPSWEEYAKKGLAIVEKTTQVSGHVSDHDTVLAELQSLLDTP